MEVILREDIENLGTRGEVVKVASGYARNFLLPKKLAVSATDSNRKIVEQERQAHLRKEAKQIGEAQELAKLVGAVTVTIRRKENGCKRTSLNETTGTRRHRNRSDSRF